MAVTAFGLPKSEKGAKGNAVHHDNVVTAINALETKLTTVTGVPVTTAGIHAALVTLGLITA